MPRVKIKVERGNGLQQVVVVDTEATRGATIGTNVFNADGTLYVPGSGGSTSANIRNGYGILISGSNPKTINVNRAANFVWQGTHEFQNTVAVNISGGEQWDINTARTYQSVPLIVQFPVSSAGEYPGITFARDGDGGGGFEVTLADSSTIGDDTGGQIGFWGRGSAGAFPPTGASYGFRWRVQGSGASNVYTMQFISHNNSQTGTPIWAATSNATQMRFADGTNAAPVIAFINSTGSGINWDAGNSRITFNIWGAGKVAIGADRLRTNQPIYANDGTAAAPPYSFDSDTNNGWGRITTDTIFEATAGTERRRINASGAWGLAGANYGTANTQAIVSGGASAAPSWQTVLVDGQTQTLGGDKTWSGVNVWTSDTTNLGAARVVGSGPAFGWYNTSGAVDARAWRAYASGATWGLGTLNDADNAARAGFQITRSAGSIAIATLIFGNSTDNPDHEFYGALHYASGLQNFADDAAAAAGGIAVNQLYRNGSIVQIRVT